MAYIPAQLLLYYNYRSLYNRCDMCARLMQADVSSRQVRCVGHVSFLRLARDSPFAHASRLPPLHSDGMKKGPNTTPGYKYLVCEVNFYFFIFQIVTEDQFAGHQGPDLFDPEKTKMK